MTSIEKAEAALNRRIERIQDTLRGPHSEATQPFLVQSLVVSIGIGDALTEYVRAIGHFAQGRHAELKRTHDSLTERHAELLKSGNALLEQLKTDPSDPAVRKEIERVQRDMAAVQKSLRRDANSLQREIAPSMATLDKLGATIRRLGEAEDLEALQRAIALAIGNADELYNEQPGLPSKHIIDAESWKNAALSALEHAAEFHEAYAQAAYQVMLALDLMTLAVSPNPPQTAEEATHRANDITAARVKGIMGRFASGS